MSIIVYKQRFLQPIERFTPIRNYLHIGYIAMRPRSMKNEDGVHGLFGYLSPNESCDKMPWQETAKYVRQLSKSQNVNIFRSIISFNRDDADEVALKTQQDWRKYAELHIRTLAEKNGIALANLGWCGAYHNEGEHPHLHIVFWDRTQTIAKTYVPPKVANDVRIALIKSTFEERIKALYEEKKHSKEFIGKSFDEAVLDFDNFIKGMKAKDFKTVKSNISINITQLFNSDEQLASMAEKLFRLRTLIPKGGRVAYKLLPPEVKVEIDSLADELIKNNTYLKNAIEQYIDSQCKLKELYSSLDDPDKLKAYRDKCEGEAKNQICSKIVKSVKAIISKEYEIKNEEFTSARKQYFAMECMREILQFFANGIVDNHSALYEKQGKIFGDLSERAMKEWYLKNKDKGMEY